MKRLLINALAASAGGGVTYIRNVIPHLSGLEGLNTTVLVSPKLRRELGNWSSICFGEIRRADNVSFRFWNEQRYLPELIRRSGAEVLISAGNFALWKSPIPQVLLSRNALYTSNDFRRDLQVRGDYRMWLDTKLKAEIARNSVRHATCTVAPSEAFAQELRDWTGARVVAIHHGFDHEAFFADQTPLPEEIRAKLSECADALRLLFVSHYNYYRNFETLIRALPLIKQRIAPRRVKLILTCRFHDENHRAYRADTVANLVTKLKLEDSVVQLGSVPYSLSHNLYRAADVYVSPAYAESFAHPLVEAMASGVPVVASDIAVHREICREAAHYFPRFSPEALAHEVGLLADGGSTAQAVSRAGLQRSHTFSWRKHVSQIVTLAGKLNGNASS